MRLDLVEKQDEFYTDVVRGLSEKRKALPCKYFYDERGSQLFDQICELDEYYPTRTELALMREHALSIASQIDTEVMLVELGSGSSLKTRVLLDSLHKPTAYVPVDISEEHLLRTAADLRVAYPQLPVLPVVADFTEAFVLPTCQPPASHVALYFPGSTIGNFTPTQAGRLLRTISGMLGPQGGLLIGIDLQKNPAIIESAYNDKAGVTAAFNLNLLHRINRELDGTFCVDAFKHRAVYNAQLHRIEISLVSLEHQSARVGSQEFDFTQGEEIITEYSHKYTVEGFATFAANYGFDLHMHWVDAKKYFGILHLVLN